MTVGYDSTLSGGFTIDPPLRYVEFKDSPFGAGGEKAREAGLGVCLVEERETVETDDGPLERRTASRVVFAWNYPVKLYDIVTELQGLVDAFPDHEFTGEFQGEGSDFGDIWLLRVTEDRKVVRILPTITWPDGTVLHNERYK